MNVFPVTDQAYQLLHDGALALCRAELYGMRVDVEYCEKKQKHLTRQINRLRNRFLDSPLGRKWRKLYGGKINLNSDQQLAKILYDVMGITPPKHTESGAGSVDTEALENIGLPELTEFLRIRRLQKVRDTYLGAFVREQVGGYLHPFFNLHLARTYRSSSDSPNFQNIPKRDKEAMEICRRALLPHPGHQLGMIDFSGIEVCISACCRASVWIRVQSRQWKAVPWIG